MVCEYLQICKELDLDVDSSVKCEPVTVMIWLCENHAMRLCDNHVLSFNQYCPYHVSVRLFFTLLDRPVPQ